VPADAGRSRDLVDVEIGGAGREIAPGLHSVELAENPLLHLHIFVYHLDYEIALRQHDDDERRVSAVIAVSACVAVMPPLAADAS
jgi:hypothetical protein